MHAPSVVPLSHLWGAGSLPPIADPPRPVRKQQPHLYSVAGGTGNLAKPQHILSFLRFIVVLSSEAATPCGAPSQISYMRKVFRCICHRKYVHRNRAFVIRFFLYRRNTGVFLNDIHRNKRGVIFKNNFIAIPPALFFFDRINTINYLQQKKNK